jgi:hypothetical protein
MAHLLSPEIVRVRYPQRVHSGTICAINARVKPCWRVVKRDRRRAERFRGEKVAGSNPVTPTKETASAQAGAVFEGGCTRAAGAGSAEQSRERFRAAKSCHPDFRCPMASATAEAICAYGKISIVSHQTWAASPRLNDRAGFNSCCDQSCQRPCSMPPRM